MLSQSEITSVNQLLTEGNVAAVVKILEGQVDLRAKEMPALDKPALAALGKHLKADPAKAALLGESALHPNISVRRFVRKVAMSLKGDAAPLAGPIRERLEKYLAETIALDYSDKPKEAALRREQADVLDTSAELLRRCDLTIFLQYLGELMEHWEVLAEEHNVRMAPVQAAAKERGEAVKAAFQIGEQRTKAIFEERFAKFGFKIFELSRSAPQIWQELSDAVEADPEVQAAKAKVQALPVPSPEPDQPTGPQTLMVNSYNVIQAFEPALLLGWVWDPSKPVGAEQQRIVDTFWGWLEEAILKEDVRAKRRVESFGRVKGWSIVQGPKLQENAIPILTKLKAEGRDQSAAFSKFVHILAHSMLPREWQEDKRPIPAELTPKALLGFKNGKQPDEQFLERIAQNLAERYKKLGQTIPDAPPAAQKPEAKPEAAAPAPAAPAPAGSLAEAAGRYTSMEERLEALKNPPVVGVKKILQTRQEPASRADLISQWREQPGWDEAAFAAAATPVLWELLESELEAYKTAAARKKPVAELAKEARSKMTAAQIKDWEENQLFKEQCAVENEADEIIYSLQKLGGIPALGQAIGRIQAHGLESYESRRLKAVGNLTEHRPDFSAEDIATLRVLFKRLAELEDRNPDESERTWRRQLRATQMTIALYKSAADPAFQAEARALAAKHGVFRNELARMALANKDHEFLMPLMTAAVKFTNWDGTELAALWDHTRTAEPEAAKRYIGQILTLVAAGDDAKALKFPIGMLDATDKKQPWPAATLPDLHAALENPLPAVNRLALERLGPLAGEEADWDALSALAAEKMFSDNGPLAKEAAKFLGTLGSAREDQAPAAISALADGLAVNNLTLQEAALKALADLKKTKRLELDGGTRQQVEALAAAQPAKLGKLCQKLLA
jgi:hypothetical protein